MAKVQMKNTCSYCGQPLELIAGFCSVCHAPAMVARRQLLIAQSKRLDHPPVPHQPLLLNASLPSQEPDVMPFWVLIIAIVSLITLSASILIMVTRASPQILPDLAKHNANALVITGPNGQIITTGHAGKPITVTYSADIKNKLANITLSITMQQSPPHIYTTQWSSGSHTDHITFIPLVGGNWVCTFAVDGVVIRSIILPVQPS